VEQLKNFIRKPGLKLTKRCKDELVAIAYDAIQYGMKTEATAEEQLLMKSDLYQIFFVGFNRLVGSNDALYIV
jgi:hypothetical protein